MNFCESQIQNQTEIFFLEPSFKSKGSIRYRMIFYIITVSHDYKKRIENELLGAFPKEKMNHTHQIDFQKDGTAGTFVSSWKNHL